MKKCWVGFKLCVLDSREYGSDNEHMVSRVFFDLRINGEVHPGLYCDLKQVVGSSYETGDIEVGRPVGYKGPFNYNGFRDEVEKYYRSLVGAHGRMFKMSGEAHSVRFHDIRMEMHTAVEFDADDSGAGGW